MDRLSLAKLVKPRGLLGIRGAIGDYRAFLGQGYGWRMALRGAVDYWFWDLKNWMGWDGRPR
jgi:hypothetical protein